MRTLKPTGSGFASMHAKAWIFDEKTVLSGSCNLTHGGFDNNVEHMFRITTPSVVTKVQAEYEKLWKIAEPVTEREIEIMMSTAEKKGQSKARRGASRSMSVDREGSAIGDTVL